HLHAHGLVHRDVKPSNILFVGGEPKLADAGLVAAVDDARSLVGTAGYIAPEGPGTPQADLYALGKVLYEAAFRKDRQEFPALPADVASRPDHARLLELNSILLKACATDRRKRYRSADHIRADLELLRAGRSVKRQQAWAQTSHVAKKVGLAIGTVAILCASAFWLAVREARPRSLEWSKNEEANEAYRNGISLFHLAASNSFVEAAKLFELAVQKDPNFARANARLARSYVWQNPTDRQMLAKASGFAQRAFALNPDSDEANSTMAVIKTLLEYDWSGAEKHHLKAISLNPDGQHAEDNFYSYATFLSIMGRTNEAIKQVNKALALGSPSFVWMQTAGFVYLCARQYDQAIRVFEEIVRQQPSSRDRVAPNFLIPAYRYSHNFPAAIQWEEQADPARGAALREAYEKGGELGYWRRCLDLDKNSSTDLVWLAILHARVGENDSALDDLEQALKRMPTEVVLNINRDPSFDTLRGNPRFENVRKKLGFR
ncbi:MAG: hypothetical protein HY674_17050, partial [Chloroflexi bacterium]|nr:hypothetical protein [Chloroflexota bacterium]